MKPVFIVSLAVAGALGALACAENVLLVQQSAEQSQFLIFSGDNQSAVAGTAVSLAPAVRLLDANGRGIPGIPIDFFVTSGGGSITPGDLVTDLGGTASVGSWTLGVIKGPNTLRVTAGGPGGVLTFNATGLAGPAITLTMSAGNNQTVAAGSDVTTPPSVLVTDANGNGVAGVVVTFAVESGGGTITGPTPTTGEDGVARVGSWKLGATAGPNTLSATASGLIGSPLTFAATGS